MNERLFLLWRGTVYSQTGWEPWRISPGSATASLYRLSTLRSKRLTRAHNFSLPPKDDRDFLIQKPLPKHILSIHSFHYYYCQGFLVTVRAGTSYRHLFSK